MTRSRLIPIVVLLVLMSGYLALVFGSWIMLPERVATHFGANGQPDGWMSRSGYLTFTALMGIGLPIFILGIMFVSRFFPASLVNVPHKAYWVAPGRREVAQEVLFDRSIWLGCLMVVFFSAMHCITIMANRSDPVRLPPQLFFPVLGLFLAGILIWVIALYRVFRRPS